MRDMLWLWPKYCYYMGGGVNYKQRYHQYVPYPRDLLVSKESYFHILTEYELFNTCLSSLLRLNITSLSKIDIGVKMMNGDPTIPGWSRFPLGWIGQLGPRRQNGRKRRGRTWGRGCSWLGGEDCIVMRWERDSPDPSIFYSISPSFFSTRLSSFCHSGFYVNENSL